MLTRDDVIKRVGEIQVLTNQTDVRTDVILLTMITMQLEDIESRLTAIEINTMNAQGQAEYDEPITARPADATAPAASTKAAGKV